MKLFGLCGPSGSGKTLVGKLFAIEGFSHIDCDKLVHERVYIRPDVRDDLSKAFGADIITPTGVNRKKLGKTVFSDPKQLSKLNDLLRRPIREEIFALLKEQNAEYALLDAPTLFEAGIDKDCTCVIGMIAPYNTCLERIVSRDGITREQAAARLSRQKDEAFLRRHCDYILVNDGNIVKLTKQALSLAAQLKGENNESRI